MYISVALQIEVYLTSVLQHYRLGNRKGIWPVKTRVLVCWWWSDWS